jgi:hypothetical protein
MSLGTREFSRLAAAGSSDDGLGGLVRPSQLAWIGKGVFQEGLWLPGCKWSFAGGVGHADQLVIGQLAMAMAFCEEQTGCRALELTIRVDSD